MLKEEIEKLRDCLNMMIISEEANDKEILRVSQELDCLILKYMELSLHVKNAVSA